MSTRLRSAPACVSATEPLPPTSSVATPRYLGVTLPSVVGRLSLAELGTTASGGVAVRAVPVDQPAESMDSKSIQCGFESHRGHQKYHLPPLPGETPIHS